MKEPLFKVPSPYKGASPWQVTVVHNIKRLRKIKGWTQSNLAEHCDCSLSLIRDLESFNCKVSIDTLATIAEALGTTEGALLMKENGGLKEATSEELLGELKQRLSVTKQTLY